MFASISVWREDFAEFAALSRRTGLGRAALFRRLLRLARRRLDELVAPDEPPAEQATPETARSAAE